MRARFFLVLALWLWLGRPLLAQDSPVLQAAIQPLADGVPEVAIERLARSAERSTAVAGETVVRQGERGERFFVVEAGELDVSVDGTDVATLRAGDYFGEIALLRDVPRTATVRVRRDSALLALERHDFLSAVAGYAPSLSSAEAVVGLRLGGRA